MLFFPSDPVSHTLILCLWGSEVQVCLMWQWILSDQWKLWRTEIFLLIFRSAEQQKYCKILCDFSVPAKSQELFGCGNSNWESKRESPAVARITLLSAAVSIKSLFLLFVLYISTVVGIVNSVRRLADSKLNSNCSVVTLWPVF